MIFICTGISCSGRKELLGDLKDLCNERDINAAFFDIGDYMRDIAKDVGIRFTDEKVLDSDPIVLALARRLAFCEISKQLQDVEHAFVGVHICFRWRGVLLEGLAYHEILDFPVDMFINVVDSLEDILKKMESNPQWFDMSQNEVDIWIDEEEFLTKQIANFRGKPYYLVTRQYDLDNLYNLLFSSKKKLYLSYPITLLRDKPEEIEKIRTVGKELAKHFIVFDPLDIKDMSLALSIEADESETKLSMINDDTLKRIKTRTITRDYQFIRQSDFVVVIYPTDKLSIGVLSEIILGSRYNKPVYAVYSHARSIFLENSCSEIFNTIEELKEFLIENYGEATS